MGQWSDYLQRWGVILHQPEEPVARPPTEEQLNEAETALGVRFPASHRSFCLELGPGLMSTGVQIYAPTEDAEHADLNAFAGAMKGVLAERDAQSESDVPLERLIAFAEAADGTAYCWNPEERTAGDEMAIFALDLSSSERPLRVASSFQEFIDTVCLDASRAAEGPGDEVELAWTPLTVEGPAAGAPPRRPIRHM